MIAPLFSIGAGGFCYGTDEENISQERWTGKKSGGEPSTGQEIPLVDSSDFFVIKPL
jgi:hypothetical protein